MDNSRLHSTTVPGAVLQFCTAAASHGLAVLLASVCLCCPAFAQATSLFDGRSLNGWEHDADHWRVENGAIVGEIPKGQSLKKNTWIVWRGGELQDFDLRLQVKLTGAASANSGIQIRCQVDEIDHVSGYQADLDQGQTWLGRIYDEHGRGLIVERGQRVHIAPDGTRNVQVLAPAEAYSVLFRDREWNDYRIVAIGERISIFVNGTLFADLVDQEIDQRDLAGSLAFQLHSGPETRVEFRNIELEQLEAEDTRLGNFTVKSAKSNTLNDGGITPLAADGTSMNFDFESGDLSDWSVVGDAFQGQPIRDDGIASRWPQQISNKRGEFFIAGFENIRDAGTGTLTSTTFEVTSPFASYLVGGGKSRSTRVELVLPVNADGEEEVISEHAGNQREQMQRVLVDLRAYQNAKIAIRLVDESTGGWGHLNFDDFRFHQESDLKERGWNIPGANVAAPDSQNLLTSELASDNHGHAPTAFADSQPAPEQTVGNPLLQHLIPNPVSEQANGTIRQMRVPEGFSVDLIAAEPLLHQPIAFTFDAKGRLWVVEGHSYPNKRPEGEGLDRVLIFSDQDANGTFETRKVFYEGLNLVSGMQVGFGGVWIGAAPELLFIPDRNGDDQPDGPPEVLLDGFGYADTHETLNSFMWGPDGWLYGNQGVFNQSLVGKPGSTDKQRNHLAAGIWRYHPTRKEFEVFAHGGSNQWGLDFNEYGQLFMTHCRSYWGGGPTTHVIQGGHYWNQINGGYASFISPNPIADMPEMRNFLLASARYGHGEGGAGKRGTRAVYGGHSHVGTMIYLGDNWPAEYRNQLFTHNLHGHRINRQENRREGSGYNTVHAGTDVLLCGDPQYVAVDLQYGPDGAVYTSDWYDPRHCHSPNNEQWDRGNGRIYRMKYNATYTPAKVDYTQVADSELIAAQLHSNEWHVRMARLVLTERAVTGNVDQSAIQELRKMATSHADETRRLRALWCLHAIAEIDLEIARELINDQSEYLRAWVVQLLAEDATLPGNLEFEDLLIDLASREHSLFVRQYLASATSRLSQPTAWTILEQLATQPDNAVDRNLPLLIWQQLAERMADNLPRAIALADSTKIPVLKNYILWYAPQLSAAGRDAVAERLASSRGNERVQLLSLFSVGLQGMRGLQQPAAWTAIANALYDSKDASTRQAAQNLGATFGDEALFDQMRITLAAEDSTTESKAHALSILASDLPAGTWAKLPAVADNTTADGSRASSSAALRAEAAEIKNVSHQNALLLMSALDTPELAVAAIRQLKSYNDPRVASELISRLPVWQGETSEIAMETLCSRVPWAKQLLAAFESKRIDKGKLTAFYARQMSNLGDEQIVSQLTKLWGKLGESSAETKSAIENLVAQYSEAPLWAYSRSAGEGHFKTLCASCHVKSDLSQRIGPKLEGSGSKGIHYIVENILDPNAVIGKDFQARQILTIDGLIVTGVIIKETDSAVTVRTANATQTIARDDIEEIVISKTSFMPQGLLGTLNDQQQLELLKYLMSK
ncbi:PVC-type heme-binding CxxCH protein [Aureliella helgolandensis]|uniref:Cytochrome c domain-containing protein n=1 Tax=Aureliella helgolandensis TaxID=2527968 RepID=A0A518G1Q2_9BACT|nr:PVC-type heme-binding CxxCH protein [Aureliella helgolandensis]QDV22515.1 hypothetical protein Q31a_08010 [Aureliella helgolandensis]